MSDETKIWIELCICAVLIVALIILDNNSPVTEEKEQHECTIFVKYNEHYQITPLSWWYRESFKCTECGKDYKK